MRIRDLQDDHPLSLPDAAEYLGKLTGRKPHVSTLWRWCLKGCKGVWLESICIGGKRFVTATAIEASTTAQAGFPEYPTNPTSRSKQRDKTCSRNYQGGLIASGEVIPRPDPCALRFEQVSTRLMAGVKADDHERLGWVLVEVITAGNV